MALNCGVGGGGGAGPNERLVAAGWGPAGQASLRCYLRNDSPWAVPSAQIRTSLLHLSSGHITPLAAFSTRLPSVGDATPGGTAPDGDRLIWFCAGSAPGAAARDCPPTAELLATAGCAADGSDCLLQLSAAREGEGASSTSSLASTHVALTPPKSLACSATSVVARVTASPSPTAPGSVATIAVSSSAAVACYVVLTSAAAGRFERNGFFVPPGPPTRVGFFPFGEQAGAAQGGDQGGGSEALPLAMLHTRLVSRLEQTLRVEHLFEVMH